MDVIRMLVLEDEETQQELWKDAVTLFNRDHEAEGPRIMHDVVATAEEARAKLSGAVFDCMVSDLRVPEGTGKGNPKAAAGNSAVEFVFLHAPCPVAIFSGYPEDYVSPSSEWPAPCFTRSADAFREVLDWFKSQTALMVTVRDARLRLGSLTAQLFHRSLWRRWEQDAKAVSVDGLVRQLAGHVAEELAVTGANLSALAGEHYFDPPMRDRLHTGDLLRENGNVMVVLSPQCDMVRDYPENIMLAVCEPVDRTASPWKDLAGAGEMSKTLAAKLNDQIRQKIESSRHFLPPLAGEGPWHVRFDRMSTIPNDQVDRLRQNRFASITPAFVPNLTHRFASYLGRPGQPALDSDSTRSSCQVKPAAARGSAGDAKPLVKPA